MRLIDADKFECVVLPDHSSNEFCDGATFILEKIDTAPTVNQWIPTSERLPKRGESVLLYDLDGDIYLGHLATGCNYYYADYCDDRIKNVLAWTPLPEPYKG